MSWKSKSGIELTGKDVLGELAQARGIKDVDTYLNPSSKHMISPYKLKNMKEIVERVMRGIEENDKITIISDPDADGVTSTVIAYDYLSKFTDNITYKTHERSEGHGVIVNNIESDTDVVLIIDSSSNSIEECKELQDKGMDVLIIDHHNADQENPYALICNPQLQEDYPNKQSSAASLVYKFVEMMDYEKKQVHNNHYIDLAGFGILGDSMRMDVPENRYLLSQALDKVRNVGLFALMKEQKLDTSNLSATDISYKIIPVINSITRMNEIDLAFDLLLEKDYKEAKKKAKEVIKLNNKRKKEQKKLMEKAEDNIRDEKFIIATYEGKRNYNGLIAAQLVRKHNKPTIALDSEKLAGSARSHNNIPILEEMQRCPYVEMARGHDAAFGIEIKEGKLEEFIEWINTELDHLTFDKEIDYDVEIDEDLFDEKVVKDILTFNKITGNGVDPVKVRVNNLLVEERQLFPPKTKDHLKIIAGDDIELLKFNEPDYMEDIDTFSVCSVIGMVGVNNYNGNLSIIVDDLKEAE